MSPGAEELYFTIGHSTLTVADFIDTVRKVGVRQLVETAAVPSAQLWRNLAQGCRSLPRFEPSTSYVLPAATSASAGSRPSGDVAAIARYFRSVPLISARRRDVPPRSR